MITKFLAVMKFYDSTISKSMYKLKNLFSPLTPDSSLLDRVSISSLGFYDPHNSCAQSSPRVEQREGPTSGQPHRLSGLRLSGQCNGRGNLAGATGQLSSLLSYKGPSEHGDQHMTGALHRSDLTPNLTPLAARI